MFGPAISLTAAFQAGGWLMYLVIVLAALGLAFVIYLLMLLRRDQIVPPHLETDVKDLLRAGRVSEAHDRCAGHASALAAVWEAALEYALRADRPHALMLKEIVEGEHHRQVAVIQNRAQYLLDVSTGSLLVGLFCAATGLVRVFSKYGLDALKAPPEVLSVGIAQAALAAAFGLLVALAAVIAYVFLRHRLPAYIAQLEAAGGDIVRQVGRA